MNETDLFTMARTIWGEARSESQKGKIAVGWVIRNRFYSGKWYGGGTITQVCRRPSQFSCWNENDPNRAKIEALTLDDPWFLECVYVAAGVFCGQMTDPTDGASHYFAPASVARKPAWADGKEPVARIGNHLFFRDIN